MPLAPIQASIARLIAVNRSPSSHLAGAAALYLEPNSLRTSTDLDYFHDRESQVGQAFAADRKILEENGFVVDVVLSQPGFVRAIVAREGKATKVEWAHDSSWRFLPPISDPVVGFRLHPLDLSIHKVLALAGRDEPRDFLDVLFVHRSYLSLGSLCWAAVGKDPGYGPQMLVEMLARKGRFRPSDFTELELALPPRMEELKLAWLEALADARQLVQVLPPADAGCLYWNPNDTEICISHRRPRGAYPPFWIRGRNSAVHWRPAADNKRGSHTTSYSERIPFGVPPRVYKNKEEGLCAAARCIRRFPLTPNSCPCVSSIDLPARNGTFPT